VHGDTRDWAPFPLLLIPPAKEAKSIALDFLSPRNPEQKPSPGELVPTVAEPFFLFFFFIEFFQVNGSEESLVVFPCVIQCMPSPRARLPPPTCPLPSLSLRGVLLCAREPNALS